jgi:hypothetical protein
LLLPLTGTAGESLEMILLRICVLYNRSVDRNFSAQQTWHQHTYPL